MKKFWMALLALSMAVILSSCAPFWTGAVLTEGIAYAASPQGTTTDTTALSGTATGSQSATVTVTSTTAAVTSSTAAASSAASQGTTAATPRKDAPAQTTATAARPPQVVRTTKKTTAKATKKTTTKTTKKASSSNLGSKANPVKLGQTVIVDNMNDPYKAYKLQITITGIVRGQKAEDMVREANDYNDPAPGSMEYMLVKAKIKVLDSGDYSPYYIDDYYFKVVSQKGVIYETFTFVSGLEPELGGPAYIGEEQEGYFPQLIMKGDSPKIVFTGFSDREVWFATK